MAKTKRTRRNISRIEWPKGARARLAKYRERGQVIVHALRAELDDFEKLLKFEGMDEMLNDASEDNEKQLRYLDKLANEYTEAITLHESTAVAIDEVGDFLREEELADRYSAERLIAPHMDENEALAKYEGCFEESVFKIAITTREYAFMKATKAAIRGERPTKKRKVVLNAQAVRALHNKEGGEWDKVKAQVSDAVAIASSSSSSNNSSRSSISDERLNKTVTTMKRGPFTGEEIKARIIAGGNARRVGLSEKDDVRINCPTAFHEEEAEASINPLTTSSPEKKNELAPRKLQLPKGKNE